MATTIDIGTIQDLDIGITINRSYPVNRTLVPCFNMYISFARAIRGYCIQAGHLV